MWRVENNGLKARHESGAVIIVNQWNEYALYLYESREIKLSISTRDDYFLPGLPKGIRLCLPLKNYKWCTGQELSEEELEQVAEHLTEGFLSMGMAWVELYTDH